MKKTPRDAPGSWDLLVRRGAGRLLLIVLLVFGGFVSLMMANVTPCCSAYYPVPSCVTGSGADCCTF